MKRLCRAWAIGLLMGAGVLRAHDPGLSTVRLEVHAKAIELQAGFAAADVQHLTKASGVALTELASRLWEFSAAGVTVPPREVEGRLVAGNNVSLRAVFPRSAAKEIGLRARMLGRLPRGHRQFVEIIDAHGTVLAKKLLSAGDDRIEAQLGATAEEAPRVPFLGFLALGIEHIWTGYDHLLFLFALLVVCRSFRSIAAIISCFTLAHSLTLALATLGVVTVPSRLVEPAIAASIVFVGVENLWRRGAEPRGRWALTFAFGLIHGFGFASVLRDLGVGRDGQGIALPLATFNLGVELGQIAVAAVALPIVWRLRRSERFVQRGVPALSAIVVLAGGYWLLERTVLA